MKKTGRPASDLKVVHLDTATPLKQRVREEMACHGLTQAAVSKAVGVSSAVISQWLKDGYPGDVELLELKLEQWLKVRQDRNRLKKATAGAPDWVDTLTSRRIAGVVEFCHTAHSIGLIYGNPGLGKTKTLRHYAENHTNVWRMTVNPAAVSMTGCLWEIARVVGVRGAVQRSYQLMEDIKERLTGTDGVLLLDEAQHLPRHVLEAVRAIHDATGVGVVLCGNLWVYSRMKGGRAADYFAQFYSRVGRALNLEGVHKEDVKAIGTAWGVKGEEAITMLQQIAMQPGALREVVQVLNFACSLAAAKKEQLGLSHLKAAYQQRIGVLP